MTETSVGMFSVCCQCRVLLETMHWQWPENMTWLWFGLSDCNAVTAWNCRYRSFQAPPPSSSNWSEIAVAVGLAHTFGECGRLSCLVIPCCESAAFCYRCWILNICLCDRNVLSAYINWVAPYVKWGRWCCVCLNLRHSLSMLSEAGGCCAYLILSESLLMT